MKENSREEDRKILEKLINTMKSDRELFDEKIDKEIYAFFINALEHILSDYKRVLKENEELKNDYENLSNSVVVKNHCIKNSIPVSLVEEKLEELIKEGRHYNANKIEVLQELLEGRK